MLFMHTYANNQDTLRDIADLLDALDDIGDALHDDIPIYDEVVGEEDRVVIGYAQRHDEGWYYVPAVHDEEPEDECDPDCYCRWEEFEPDPVDPTRPYRDFISDWASEQGYGHEIKVEQITVDFSGEKLGLVYDPVDENELTRFSWERYEHFMEDLAEVWSDEMRLTR